MRKKIFILLVGVTLFLLVGCGNNKIKNNDDVTNNGEDGVFEIVETTEKKEPKYHSKYFSATALVDIVSQFNYDESKQNQFYDLYEAINGRIVDTFYYDECIYFLTPAGMYRIHQSLFYLDTIEIDIGNNNQIELITDEYIVLKNDNDELTVYFSRYGQDKYSSYRIDDFSILEDDFLVGYSDSSSWDYLYIISDIDKDGITAKTFSMGDAFSEINDKFVMQKEEKHPFSIKLDSDIEEYVVSKNNYSLNGMVLLKNYKAYYIEAKFGDLYLDETINVRTEAIENVDKIFNTLSEREFFITKTNDDKSLYRYYFYYGNGEISVTETKIDLLNGVKTSDIVSISTFDGETSYVTLSNGEIYEFSNVRCLNGGDGKYSRDDTDKYLNDFIVKDEYVFIFKNDIIDGMADNKQKKHDVITNVLKGEDNIEYYLLEGLSIFVMDDGNIYTLLDDEMIEKYNLK